MRISKRSLGLRSLILTSLLVGSLSWIQIPAAQAVSTNPTPDCSAGSTCTVTFVYTGDYYGWTVPNAGDFTLEVWGAQGGNGLPFSSVYASTGGAGGYAKGVLTASAGSTLNIYIGGQGGSTSAPVSSSSIAAAGWNGGGSATLYGMSGGGGATDIRSGSTTLSSRVIIAGGGGGGGNAEDSTKTSNGGPGGGLTAPTLSTATQYGSRTPGSGATQSSGFALGDGAPSSNDSFRGAGGGGYHGGRVGLNSTGGGGGSGYIGTLTSTSIIAGNATMSNPAGGTMVGRAGNGIAKITYLNAPAVSSFTSAQSTPTNTSSSISYAITFSQNVNTVANADFVNAGTATSCSFSISAASGTSFTLTVSSCSDGTLIPKVLANSVYGTVTSTNGPAVDSLATTTITIDQTLPTISSVTGPSGATYFPTNNLNFTVTTSETVTVTGTPRIAITIGSTTRYANYLSGSGSSTLIFRYSVTTDSGDIDTDGIAVASPLQLNSGSIVDLATNAMSTLTFTPPATSSVLVAQLAAAPTITAITAGDTSLSVAFSAGASNGSAISNYRYSTDNGSTWRTRASGTTATPLVIGTTSATNATLVNATTYQVRLRAVTSAGNGDSSTAVSATPTAVTVAGGSNISRVYGSASSSSAFTASGGTSPYVFTITNGASGISVDASTGVVSAASTLTVGSYAPNVVATDSYATPRIGSKAMSITISQATPTITIALPNSATDAALGAAITITASVSQDGTITFKVGAATISGCGSLSSSTGSATCSWSPSGSLGSQTLSATLVPTDSTNYTSPTSSGLVITVVSGVSTLSLSLAGDVITAQKGRVIVITAAIDQVGKVSFFVDGKRIPKCFKLSASDLTKTCSWKPTVQRAITLSARLVPTNSAYNSASGSLKVQVTRRTGTR